MLTPSPVAQAAERLGVNVVEAARLDERATAAIAALEPDLGVIVAYGGLDINDHQFNASLWRFRALTPGDRVTGLLVLLARWLRRQLNAHLQRSHSTCRGCRILLNAGSGYISKAYVMSSTEPIVSVIVIAATSERTNMPLFDAILAQRTDVPYNVIVVDSSVDRTPRE